MTRKSKREIERALDTVSSGSGQQSVEQWAENYQWGSKEWEFTFDDVEDGVAVLDTGLFTFYAPPADVPEWIDVETDLPVEP